MKEAVLLSRQYTHTYLRGALHEMANARGVVCSSDIECLRKLYGLIIRFRRISLGREEREKGEERDGRKKDQIGTRMEKKEPDGEGMVRKAE